MTPMARTLTRLRARGFIAAPVERWLPRAGNEKRKKRKEPIYERPSH
jgi:hypothetical protein